MQAKEDDEDLDYTKEKKKPIPLVLDSSKGILYKINPKNSTLSYLCETGLVHRNNIGGHNGSKSFMGSQSI